MPRQIREKNTGFTNDTTGLEIPKGTTAERPASGNAGSLRFNTTIGALEQWTGNAWDPIYPTPQIFTVTSSTVGLNEDDNSTITIIGSSLNSIDTVVYKNHSNGSTIATAGSVTIVSDTEINFPYVASSFTAGQQISIEISSTASGKSAIAAAVFTISADPVWQTSSGSLGTVGDGSRTGYSVNVLATTPDSVAVQYELSQGSLPAGASLSTNGTISGNLTVVTSSTTSSFHIMAVAQTVDSSVRRTERQFSITVSPPVITFTPASGSLGTLPNFNRNSNQLTALSAAVTSGSITNYAITTGSLPAGLSINSSTGAITGTADAVGSNTTTSFTVTATATGDYGTITNTASLSITVQAPAVTTFTSSGTFTVPVGLTSVDVLVVAGGGSGGAAGGGIQWEKGGGGGAGGFIYRPAYPISPGTPISVTVGDGASPASHSPHSYGNNGNNSVFSGLTAVGGGGGGGNSGGSGGGQRGYSGGVGPGTQPGQPGDSGTYGFGFNGSPNSGQQSGGGGGAGAAGSVPNGGVGRSNSITGSPVFYAGGGAGYVGSGGQGGGGSYNGQSASSNTGGGGGCGHETPSGAGGKGVVIVAY
jgi:hypothetical protein